MKFFTITNAKNDTIRVIAVIILLSMLAVFMPFAQVLGWFGIKNDLLVIYLSAFIRIAFAVFFIVICKKLFPLFGFNHSLSALIIIPALVMAVNNFPFIPLFKGIASFPDLSTTIAMIVYCLGVGMMEEIVYRGLVFPLVLIKSKNYKFPCLWAILISSAVFALVHLFNLLSGFNPAVFLQVGYSFLVGCVCAVVLCYTHNVVLCMFVHAVYDVGGLIVQGQYWITSSVILTACVGVIVAGIFLVVYFKKPPTKFYNLILDTFNTKGEGDNE